MKRIISKYSGIILIILLVSLIICANSAFASENSSATPLPTAKPIPQGMDIIYTQYSQNLEILMLKSKLYENGYYIAQAKEDDLRSEILDDYTMLAIQECCRKNNLPYSDHGIMREAWNTIINGQILNANATPAPATAEPEDLYPFIYWESTDPAVFRLQEKLKSLGYGINMHTGIYDQAMLETIEEFCTLNNIAYDQRTEGGIAPWLQQLIITNDAVAFYTPSPSPAPTTTAAPEKDFSGKILGYFASPVNVLGLDVAMIFIWLLCMALIAGCIFIALHFFMPVDPNSRRAGSNKQTCRPDGSKRSGKVEFSIDYCGNVEHYTSNMKHVLEIGRNVGDFPLNMDDIYISRKHCEIYHSNGMLMMRDFSSNGTMINGKPCTKFGEYMLHNGDILQIGQHIITIQF